jgi:preprotein translocase subunit YajC
MSPNTLLFMFVPLFLLMILMSTFGARKEKKKRAEMLTALGRYDRVQTTGGLIGTIVEIKDDELVLKVDESTNTKIHFSRAAVASVLKKAPGSGGSLAPSETAGSV